MASQNDHLFTGFNASPLALRNNIVIEALGPCTAEYGIPGFLVVESDVPDDVALRRRTKLPIIVEPYNNVLMVNDAGCVLRYSR